MTPHHIAKTFNTKVMIPGSKSMTYRVLLLAALSDGISEIEGMLVNEEILLFVEALHRLGIMIHLDQETFSCIVGGNDGQFPRQEAFIHCGQAKTATLFLMAACAASVGRYEFNGTAAFAKHSLKSFIEILTALGVTVLSEDQSDFPIIILGAEKLKGGEIAIDAAQNGQLVSALLMIAPFAKSNIIIKAKNIMHDPDVNMTCDMMGDFGVLVRRMHQSFFSVPVPQRYHARFYQVEPDLLVAAYFFAAAALTGQTITIQPINIAETKQAEFEFLTFLKKMGCKIIDDENGLQLTSPDVLQGINADMRNCSSTFMALAVIAPFAVTPTTLTNIQSTKHTVVRKELEKCGIKIEEGKDWLKIFPSTPKAAIVQTHQEYQLAMAFAILKLKVPGLQVEDRSCIESIYPQFFKLWNKFF